MTQAGVRAQKDVQEQYGSGYGTRVQTTTFYHSPLGRPQNSRGGRGSDRNGGRGRGDHGGGCLHINPFLNPDARPWFGHDDRDMQSSTYDPGSE